MSPSSASDDRWDHQAGLRAPANPAACGPMLHTANRHIATQALLHYVRPLLTSGVHALAGQLHRVSSRSRVRCPQNGFRGPLLQCLKMPTNPKTTARAVVQRSRAWCEIEAAASSYGSSPPTRLQCSCARTSSVARLASIFWRWNCPNRWQSRSTCSSTRRRRCRLRRIPRRPCTSSSPPRPRPDRCVRRGRCSAAR